MSRVDLSNLRVGDVIKTSRTMNVVAKHPGGREVEGAPDFFRLEDVQSGQAVYVEDGGEQGSWSWEMVKTAKAPKTFKVLDEAEGGDYELLPVGTLVVDDGGPILKTADGWRCALHGKRYESRHLSDSRTIAYLPDPE